MWDIEIENEKKKIGVLAGSYIKFEALEPELKILRILKSNN